MPGAAAVALRVCAVHRLRLAQSELKVYAALAGIRRVVQMPEVKKIVSARVDPYVAREVDRVALANNLTRSETLAALIRFGLLDQERALTASAREKVA